MSTAQAAAVIQQYLTCTLGDEVFALAIGKVREVLDFPVLTKIPRSPDFIRGVVNLRGTVVPVADLRVLFGMSRTEHTVNTCVIILEVRVGEETVIVGALADSVQEVIDLSRDQMEPAPRMGGRLRTEFISAIGKQGSRMFIVLDLDRVFSSDDLQQLQEGEEGGRQA